MTGPTAALHFSFETQRPEQFISEFAQKWVHDIPPDSPIHLSYADGYINLYMAPETLTEEVSEILERIADECQAKINLKVKKT